MYKSKKFIAVLVITLVLVFAMSFAFAGCKKAASGANATVIETTEETTAEPTTTVESTDSSSTTEPSALAEKVTIKAYLHLGTCGEEVTDLLDGLVKEYKGRVSVEYIDFGTEEGLKRTIEDGLTCQGLFINGKQTYTIKDSKGKQREVTFSHPLNDQYTADDLKSLVKQLLGE